MRPWILLPLFALTLPSLGCLSAVHDESEDERMELPPQPLPLEGTPTAFGMLRVANELDMHALDHEVGLDERSAQSILLYRAGEDARLGTADDRYVDSIARLDALHWLGEANLWTLQKYALLEGYVVDELPEATCDPMLVEAIDDCLRFTDQAADHLAPMEHRVPSCLTQSEPSCPSSEFFASAGLTNYGDPMLGYYAMLCGSDPSSAPCELGVAGFAAHLAPYCDERYDTSAP